MSFRKKEPVYISVYMVKPRRSTGNRPCHHHHHHHHVHRGSCGGYDRKAELLKYCQQLRASAHREEACPAPETISKLSSGKIAPLRRNLSVGRCPSCLGNCKRLWIPSFILKSAESFRRKKRDDGDCKEEE